MDNTSITNVGSVSGLPTSMTTLAYGNVMTPFSQHQADVLGYTLLGILSALKLTTAFVLYTGTNCKILRSQAAELTISPCTKNMRFGS